MIEIELVSLVYPGAVRPALDDVSLKVSRGDFVALVGASGSGKTTLLKTVNRLIDPDRGTVRIDGEDVSGIPGPSLRRRIGYAFQGVGLFSHMSVAENIGITPRLLGWSRTDIAARVSDLLALVDLPEEIGARAPSMLSGGQQQRVGVARALAARPDLMLMDEPFGALDPLTRDALGEAYRGLHEKLGLTTIMVTHDMQEALLLASRIVVMDGGRIVADAAPRDMMHGDRSPEVARLLDVPRRQTARLNALFGATDGGRHV